MEDAPATVSPSLTVDTFAAQLLDGESPMTAVPVVEGDVDRRACSVSPRSGGSDAPTWANDRVEDVMAKPPEAVVPRPERTRCDRRSSASTRRASTASPCSRTGELVGVLTKRGIGRFIHDRSDPPKDPIETRGVERQPAA